MKDPSTFAPPPKHVRYYGDSTTQPATTFDARDSVAPSSNYPLEGQREAKSEEAREGPPLPYRADTTGLSTRHLPKPPIRTTEAQNPVSSTSSSTKPKPPLPPRLPPRRIPHPSTEVAPEAPPPYSEAPSQTNNTGSLINQGALNRLGSAGIRVSGLGIGGESTSSSSWQNRSKSNNEPLDSNSVEDQRSQIQSPASKFSNLATNPSPSETPAQGTSFAQKQAALKTANSFRNDPTSVSLSDARAAASTASNFQERHGEQVAAGWKTGNALNKKYKIADKFSEHTHPTNDTNNNGETRDSAVSQAPTSLSFGTKLRSPPPVPKKPFAAGSEAVAPLPPVPWGSKPKP